MKARVAEIKEIATHAPARGATSGIVTVIPSLGELQPTLLREERPGVGLAARREGIIATHAPARGATRNKRHLAYGAILQPTLLREERRLSRRY